MEQQHQGASCSWNLLDGFSRNSLEPRPGRGALVPKPLWPSQVAGPALAGWPRRIGERSSIQPNARLPLRHEASPSSRLAGALSLSPSQPEFGAQRGDHYATFIAEWRLPAPRNCGLSEGWRPRWLRAGRRPRYWRGSGPCLRLEWEIQPGPAAAPCNPERLPVRHLQLRSKPTPMPAGRCPAAQRGRVGGPLPVPRAPGRGRWPVASGSHERGWAALCSGRPSPYRPLPGLPTQRPALLRGRIQRPSS